MRRSIERALYGTTKVSIHARVERATADRLPQPPSKSGFNPRTRRACDELPTHNQQRQAVSIHARVERATLTCPVLEPWRRVSIHARVERATGLEIILDKIEEVSIHARVERATDMSVKTGFKALFQSTHA